MPVASRKRKVITPATVADGDDAAQPEAGSSSGPGTLMQTTTWRIHLFSTTYIIAIGSTNLTFRIHPFWALSFLDVVIMSYRTNFAKLNRRVLCMRTSELVCENAHSQRQSPCSPASRQSLWLTEKSQGSFFFWFVYSSSPWALRVAIFILHLAMGCLHPKFSDCQ